MCNSRRCVAAGCLCLGYHSMAPRVPRIDHLTIAVRRPIYWPCSETSERLDFPRVPLTAPPTHTATWCSVDFLPLNCSTGCSRSIRCSSPRPCWQPFEVLARLASFLWRRSAFLPASFFCLKAFVFSHSSVRRSGTAFHFDAINFVENRNGHDQKCPVRSTLQATSHRRGSGLNRTNSACESWLQQPLYAIRLPRGRSPKQKESRSGSLRINNYGLNISSLTNLRIIQCKCRCAPSAIAFNHLCAMRSTAHLPNPDPPQN